MSGIPEGATTASGEGADLRNAVLAGAKELGIEADRAGYKLDMSHFRSGTGAPMARNTVKVIVWERPEGEEGPAEVKAPPAPRKDDGERGERRERRPRRDDDRERRPRRDDDRRERRGRRDDDRGERRSRRDDDRGERRPRRDRDDRDSAPVEIPEGTNDASKDAAAWFESLLGLMSLEGEVSATGNDERVRIRVKVDKAGRLIGRRGSTLASVRHLLRLAISQHGDYIIDVDVADDRPKEDRESRDDSRGERRERRDRGDRRERRGRRDDGPRGKYPEEKLRTIAQRASAKALESGKAITINVELNSYDRRVVHLETAEIDGVASQSIMKGDKKFVQIVPELAADE